MNGDGSKISADIEVINLNYRTDKNKTEEQNISEVIFEFHTSYHKRVVLSNAPSYGNYEQ